MKKRCLYIFVALFLILFIFACQKTTTEQTRQTIEATSTTTESPLPEATVFPFIQGTEGFFDTVTQPPSEKKVAYHYEGEPTDLFTVEEIDIEPHIITEANNANYFYWKIKVRNTSGADLVAKESSMRIWYRLLDKNKDMLRDTYESGGYSSTIKDGQAIWLGGNSYPNGWSKEEYESVMYLEIYGYTPTLHGWPDYEFNTPIIINVYDYK